MSTADEGNIRTWPAFIATAETGSNTVKQQNAKLRVVADELGHRLRNFVAIIQSIARQTMHQSATKDDFEARFSGALQHLVVLSIFSSPMIGAEHVSTSWCAWS